MLEHGLVTRLPPFEFGNLTSALFAVDLGGFPGEFELLPLVLENLALNLERLILQVHQEMEQRDRVVVVGGGLRRTLSSRRDFHPVCPGRRRWVLA